MSKEPVSRGPTRTRAALIAAGRNLFCHRPIESVAIDDIVQAANVAKGSFYNYFADRDALVEEISTEIRGCVEVAIQKANTEVEDPASRVARAVSSYLRFAIDDPESAGFLIRVHSGRMSLSAPLNRGLVDDISRGLRTGRFTIPTVEAGALFVLGTGQMAFVRVVEDRQLAPAVSMAQQICTLLLRGLGVPVNEADQIAAHASEDIVRLNAISEVGNLGETH